MILSGRYRNISQQFQSSTLCAIIVEMKDARGCQERDNLSNWYVNKRPVSANLPREGDAQAELQGQVGASGKSRRGHGVSSRQSGYKTVSQREQCPQPNAARQ